MATLQIEGRNVQVDDGFLKLSPEDQQSTVDEIASSFAPAEPTTVNNVVRSAATGVPIIGGLLNKADAATNAGLSYALNPLFDDKDQLTGSIGDRYAKSLAMQQGADQQFSAQHPIVDTSAKVAGSVASMIPAMAAAPAAFGLTGGLAGRIAAGVGSNAALGGIDAATRDGGDPLAAAGWGGIVGGAVPIAGTLARGVAAPLVSNIMARVNPEGFANSQFARGVIESGKTPQQIGQEVADANAAGQPLTVADAMGNPGQRMLSTVARAPGEGRTQVVNFLNNRQAGQGERVGDILDAGLGAGNTARQTVDQLTEQARRESAPLYQEALDKQPVWNNRMQQFFDDPVTAQGLKEGVGVQRLESLATGQKFDPSDYAITHFNEAGDPQISGVPNMRTVNLIKKGWDQTLEQYRDPTTGRLALDEKGRALDQVRRSFLSEVDGLNPVYAQARAAYAGPAQVRDAVGAGAQAATRGRAADNIARFQALTDPSKQGYRVGYADTRVGAIERAPQGTNVVRPLTSQKAQQELGELSLHQGPVQPGQVAPMQQALNREQTMFETRQQALGGSRTADNLADADALGIDPSVVGHLISGNYGGAVKSLIHAGSRAVTGNTPQVRQAVAQILLQHGATPAALDAMVGQTVAKLQMVQTLARTGGRAASAAAAIAPAATAKPPIFPKRKAGK